LIGEWYSQEIVDETEVKQKWNSQSVSWLF